MGLIDIAVRRPVTVAMFTLAALVFGIILLGRLGFNLLPELAYPSLTVRTELPGSAPNEIENLLSIPLEASLGTVKGLRQIRSVSKTGQSDIYLEFYWGTDMDMASLDVREKLDQVNLPLEVVSPALLRFNPNNEPIMRFSLNAISQENEQADAPPEQELKLAELRRYADLQLTRRLETIAGVAAAKASGGLEDEIQILLDPDKLAQLNLTVEMIAQRLRTQNINMSGGKIRNGYQQMLVRTFNEFSSVEDIANTIILSRDQKVVRLNEIAEVTFGHKDPTAITRHNGEQAVEISIYKEGDANIVNVAEEVKLRLASLQEELPENMRLTTLSDASVFIDQAINDLLVSAAIGGILAMLVIYLFLGDIRPTLIISATIPITVIVTFNFMYMSTIDLNIMSLGGLALAVGMLVDNAIVVLENIASKKESGLSLAEAATQGAGEVASAITASTLTTLAVFLPLIFVSGIAGQLFRDQALTIAYSLLVSLVVALTLIPMLASRKNAEAEEQNLNRELSEGKGLFNKFSWSAKAVLEIIFLIIPWLLFSAIKLLVRLFGFLGLLVFSPLRALFEKAYQYTALVFSRMLHLALKFSWTALLLALLALAGSLQLASTLSTRVLPEMAQGELVVKVQYIPGSAIELTDLRMTALSRKMLALPQVEEVFATAGVGNKLTANPEEEGENQAEFSLLLIEGLTRLDEDRLLNQLRSLLSEENSVLLAEAERPQLFNFTTPLSIQVFTYDINSLRDISAEVVRRLEASATFVDVNSNMKTGYPEAQVIFNQRALAQLNISMEAASRAVVNSIRGNTATRYRLKDQQIDVLVRLEESARNELDDLRQLLINPAADRPVPLDAVAEVIETRGPSEIMRIDQQRVAVIEGQVQFSGLSQALVEAQSLLADLPLPAGASLQFAGQGEEMDRSFNSLMMALALGVFFVYLVMASQFESLLHPFIILLSIPLALIGAILALVITQTELSVVVFLGLIMLAGIVVNNAIVLVDKVNQLRGQGWSRIEAIHEAAQARLRPILMTTLTTALGMLPLALGIGEGAEIRAPLAITVIGGLLVSTFLTLLIVPVLYSLLDKKEFVDQRTPKLQTQS